MRLTRHGTRELTIATILMLVCAGLIAWLAAAISPWLLALLAVPLPIWLWVLWFFRDPDRTTPTGEGLFIAPADGRVADITPIGPDSELGCDGIRVGIFMSVFNVHVNRWPCDGRVEKVTHHDGEFLDARDPQAIERNESTTLHLTTTAGGRDWPIVVRQIAGLVARRIVTPVQPGQAATRGERFGMIKFGSRLELLVPDELGGEVRVKLGDRSVAGETVLVSLPAQERDHDAE